MLNSNFTPERGKQKSKGKLQLQSTLGAEQEVLKIKKNKESVSILVTGTLITFSSFQNCCLRKQIVHPIKPSTAATTTATKEKSPPPRQHPNLAFAP